MARRTWDDQAADGLMELLSPVGWADIATKRDLETLETRLDAKISALEVRLLRWMVPTLLTGMAVAAGISRI